MATTYIEQNHEQRARIDAHDMIIVVARLMMVALFLVSGAGKVSGFHDVAAYVAAKRLPFPAFATIARPRCGC
jgi:uncharacterized membrane protein YphA (DoxX/SURF4 family)